MKFTKNIEEEIYSQIEAGFTKNEIKTNLQLKGTSDVEIDDAFSKINFEQAAATSSSGEGTSVKSILIGILLVVVVIYKIGRVMDGESNIFLIISIIATLVLAILYFVRRR